MSKPDFADWAAGHIADMLCETHDGYEPEGGETERIAAIIRKHAVEKPGPRDYNERTGERE
jgi:hypothetical protein